jgi:Holliday junction resolvase
MALNRRNPKRDANEREIIWALQVHGFSVEQLSKKGCGDLLLGKNGRTRLVEVKGRRGKLSVDQLIWWREWRGNKRLVLRTVEQVAQLSQAWNGNDYQLAVALDSHDEAQDATG